VLYRARVGAGIAARSRNQSCDLFAFRSTTGTPSSGAPPVRGRGRDGRRGLATSASVGADGTVARERGRLARSRTCASHRRACRISTSQPRCKILLLASTELSQSSSWSGPRRFSAIGASCQARFHVLCAYLSTVPNANWTPVLLAGRAGISTPAARAAPAAPAAPAALTAFDAPPTFPFPTLTAPYGGCTHRLRRCRPRSCRRRPSSPTPPGCPLPHRSPLLSLPAS